MKKIILLWLVVVSTMSAEAQAPVSIGRTANISLFSGYIQKHENINCNADYYGIYADYPIFTSKLSAKELNFGAWGVYDVSSFRDNMSRYKNSSSEIAGGLNTGLYFSSTSIKSYYTGLAVGYKNSQETGVIDKKNYYSESVQSDQMIVVYLNFNQYRDARWLTRMQFMTNWQYVFNSSKTVSENHNASIVIDPWNKGYYEFILKQSLVGIPLNLSADRLLEPKLGIAYHRYMAGYPEAISLIGELSLKKLFADDFMSLTFQYKKYPGKKIDYFCYGISLNVLRLIEKRQ